MKNNVMLMLTILAVSLASAGQIYAVKNIDAELEEATLTAQEADAPELEYISGSCHSENLEGWPVIPGPSFLTANNMLTIVPKANVANAGNLVVATDQGSGGHFNIFSVGGEVLTQENYDCPNQIPSFANMDSSNDIYNEAVINSLTPAGMDMYDFLEGFSNITNEPSMTAMVTYSLDGDQDIEIVRITADGTVSVRNHLGEMLPGWPLRLLPQFSQVISSHLAVGDLDKDGVLEILVQVANGYYSAENRPVVYALRLDGTVMWTFESPIAYINWFPSSNERLYFNDIVLGDVNKDGWLEVVYFFAGHGSQLPDSYFFVLDKRGKIIKEWSIPPDEAHFLNPAKQEVALGDLDGDRDLEIVVSGVTFTPPEDRIYAFHHDGTLVAGYPSMGGAPYGDRTAAPMIADVNADGYPDIVSSLYSNRNNYYNRVYAWDRNGLLIDCWPKELIRQSGASTISLSFHTETTLGDLNNDGLLDLLAAIGSNESHGVNLNVAVGKLDWPMFRHDLGRTGNYHLNKRRTISPSISAF